MQTFETSRLFMRPLQLEDEAFYCSCYTDPRLMQHIGEPLSHEKASRSFKAAMKNATELPIRRYTWVMQEKISGVSVGLLALIVDQTKTKLLNAELGNIMLTKFQNQGFTIEALSHLVNIAFKTTQLDVLFANYKTNNSAVNRVMKKLGFLCDITSRQDISNGQWVLSRQYWEAARGVLNLI
jgi:[ribosomal protein S5]-alanine N-acetyltransferase